MGRPLSLDLRERVVAAIEGGMSTRQAAARFSIGIATAGTWARLKRAKGAVTPARQGKPKGSVLDPHTDFIRGLIDTAPDITLQGDCRAAGARALCQGGVHGGVEVPRPPWPDAQKKTGHASEQERGDVKAAREAWFDSQTDLEPERLVFVDESGFSTKMARLRGWAPKGERCRAAIPHGHWKTTTFVAGLTLSGFCAPMLLDGPMDGEAFLAYGASRCSAPALQPGDIVIMDNLPAHKVAGVCEAIEAVGASLLYLPPYSPDFNPIENAFSKLKAHVRKAAARTVETLDAAVAAALNTFRPNECENFFAHAGYDRN